MSDKLDKHVDELSLIGSRTLHRETKRVLDRVEHAGEPVVIFRYGRPAAALVPIDEEQAKALALAGSPQLRARRVALAEGEASEPEPFAVAEGRVEDEEPRVEEDFAAGLEGVTIVETEPRRVRLDASLLTSQRKQARALADLALGIRDQAEALASIVDREDEDAEAAGRVDEETSASAG